MISNSGRGMQNGSMPGVFSIGERLGPEELVQGPSKKKVGVVT